MERLSTSIDRPMVEVETVRPTNREHHEIFAATLRDPTPLTPERARALKSTRTGSYSRADSVRMKRELQNTDSTKSPIAGGKEPPKTILNMRYLKTFMDQEAKQYAECNF